MIVEYGKELTVKKKKEEKELAKLDDRTGGVTKVSKNTLLAMGGLLYLSLLPHGVKELPGQIIVTRPEGCCDDGTVHITGHVCNLFVTWEKVQSTAPLLGCCHTNNGIPHESDIKQLKKGSDVL